MYIYFVLLLFLSIYLGILLGDFIEKATNNKFLANAAFLFSVIVFVELGTILLVMISISENIEFFN